MDLELAIRGCDLRTGRGGFGQGWDRYNMRSSMGALLMVYLVLWTASPAHSVRPPPRAPRTCPLLGIHTITIVLDLVAPDVLPFLYLKVIMGSPPVHVVESAECPALWRATWKMLKIDASKPARVRVNRLARQVGLITEGQCFSNSPVTSALLLNSRKHPSGGRFFLILLSGVVLLRMGG